jgi:caa(3)-type oxidase subunit IV
MTTFVTRFDLGNFNLYLALLIAVIKASIVSLYFMHLRWDRPFNGYIFMGAIVFVALFIAFILTDSHQYQPSIIWEEKKPIPAAAEAPGASEIDTHAEPATDASEMPAGEPGGTLPGDAGASGDSSGGH